MYVTGLIHPAAIMRGAWGEEPAQVRYLTRARLVAEQGHWPILDPNVPPPGALLHPTPLEFEAWVGGIGPRGISVDIETAGRHIVCVGMCRIDDLVPIVIHFLKQGGAPYWDNSTEWAGVRSRLGALLADPTVRKVFHNGQAFDVPVLKHNGFEVGGYEFDTMLAQHIAYAEMSKGLEFCAKLYLGVGGWKSMVDDDTGGEWK